MHCSINTEAWQESESFTESQRKEFEDRGQRLNALLRQKTLTSGGPTKGPFKVCQGKTAFTISTPFMAHLSKYEARTLRYLDGEKIPYFRSTAFSSKLTTETKTTGILYQLSTGNVLF